MQFVTRASCNGKAPRQLAGIWHFNRNSLLAAMMRNREVVRYLLAPTGFGKSLLALSYAELVNGLLRSYWFDCSNPCFLRDLDAGTLLGDVLDASSCGDVLVFDDVPVLGSKRREEFRNVCRALCRQERELVVCATPGADPLREMGDECLSLHAKDLLYSDADRESLREQGPSFFHETEPGNAAARVPALATGDPAAFARFLSNHVVDLDDAFQAAVSFSMLLLEQGSFDDIEAMVGREVAPADLCVQDFRPYVAVDEYKREFRVTGFPFAEVLRAFGPHLSHLAQAAGTEGAGDYALQLATILLERGRAERAASLLVDLCDPHSRSRWLEENQAYLLDCCELLSAERIYGSLKSERWRSLPSLRTGSAIRLALLDSSSANRENLAQLAGKVSLPLSLRLEAASWACLHSTDVLDVSELESAFCTQASQLRAEAKKLDASLRSLWAFWSSGASQEFDVDGVARSLRPGRHTPLALACCLRTLQLAGLSCKEYPKLCLKVESSLSAPAKDNEGAAALAMLRREAESCGFVVPAGEGDPRSAWCAAASFEDGLAVQQASYVRSKAARAGALASALHAKVAVSAVRNARAEAPMLAVRLFGGFSVRLGDVPIEDKEFRRQKLRTFLALLVLDAGRDLSCESLSTRMWPDSSSSAARHNLYNLVSMLRRGLSLADGSCPYLHRPHGVVRLEKSLLHSDVDMLEVVCRRLRFDEPDPETFLHLLEQVKELYRGELLPSERDEPMMLAAREEWRSRVVNSLSYAARRSLAIGDSHMALQMVKQALATDPQREDCYEQLMAMQARCGQRPAAIETWARYRSFLSNELGLDPTDRAARLYERIISETS